jgi:hypothetical protein
MDVRTLGWAKREKLEWVTNNKFGIFEVETFNLLDRSESATQWPPP